MKITAIKVYQVTLPLRKGYNLSGGRLYFEQLDSTLVEMETDEGLCGWGEGCPWGSTYLPAFARGIRAGIEELAPAIIGRDPRQTDRIYQTMNLALPGHPYVKSALDMACWDLLGQASGLPLSELLGGREKAGITLHSSIPTGPPEDMIASVEEAKARGYTHHSCKIGADVEQDIQRIQALTDAYGDSDSILYDVNRAWLPDQAIRVMNSSPTNVAGFEQPCETLEECIHVRRQTRQPIYLDESIQSYHDIVRAQAERTCEGIGLKIGRVGGLSVARAIRDFCVAMGLRMNIEETGGSRFADTAAVHLASSTPATHRRATWLCHDMLTIDAGSSGATNEGGVSHAPTVPGLGVEPSWDVLREPVAIYR
jgi:L-alanine-DL-glutamate epimerase-like enolase superfamily enzyme